MVLRLFALVLPGAAPWRGPRPDRMAAWIAHALPEANRSAFSVPSAGRGRHEGALADLHAARREVGAAMAREPFDAAGLRAAMAAWPGFSTVFTNTMVHAMAAVSPQGRAQVAAAGRRDG